MADAHRLVWHALSDEATLLAAVPRAGGHGQRQGGGELSDGVIRALLLLQRYAQCRALRAFATIPSNSSCTVEAKGL